MRSKKRTASGRPGCVEFGPFEVDLIQARAFVDGTRVELQPLQLRILAYLLANPGRIVTRRELHDEVLQVPVGDTRTSVVRHMSAIRRRLGYARRFITTRHGGYCVELDCCAETRLVAYRT